MQRNITLLFLICFIFANNITFAQKRKKIDRSLQTVSQNTNNSSSSNSSKSNTTSSRQRNVSTFYFSISSTKVDFSENGGTKSFSVSASNSWTISTNTESWGHLNRSGNTLLLNVDANTSASPRSDYFIISSKNKEIRVNIKQSGTNTLSVSSTELTFDSNGGTKTVSISSSNSWSIGIKTYDWGHLTTSYNAVSVKIDPNATSKTRTDYFTIKSGNLEKRINISQAGSSSIPSIKGTIKNVIVNNDAEVDGKKGLAIKVSLDVSGMKGHDGKVSCYFYDSDGNALKDINDNYGTNGTTRCVAVSKSITPSYDNTTYTDLEIKIPYDELHLSGTYGRNLRVDVLLWDYHSGMPKEITRKERTAFYCIPDVSYLKVDGCYSDKTKHFSESGGRERYTVDTSDSSYETWGVPSWCSIENKTSSSFTLVCNRNTSTSSRNDYMKVKAAGKEIRIDITQDASSGPTAVVTSVEQEHNVFNGYNKGMNIKLKFDVSGMLGKTIKATAWFYYADNTTKLNNGYGGQVNVSKSNTAPYENTTFTMTLFMPYRGLNMARGFDGSLSFDVVITDLSGNTLVRNNNNSFTYRQGW
ncbi:MAG: BACON domain-containing carbohydrate-binding protein [Prevotellaceae bacterium]|nr:BACON domain-containing carbohydrate-binding protein [Prevotellaceae bacterium]